MMVLLSPAKSLNFEPQEFDHYSEPRLLNKSKKLLKVLKKKKVLELKNLMGISDQLAQLNANRFQSFEFPFTTNNAKPAVFAFKGDVYQGLAVESFKEQSLTYAQEHLRILSGLYGLLKPLDLIQPYRLEMKTPLVQNGSKNLYQFWDVHITKLLNKDLKSAREDTLINLASKEYFKAIKPKLVKANIIHIHFKENRNGQLKVISFNAKKARGNMARQILDGQIQDPDSLKSLIVDDYIYQEAHSDGSNLVFIKEA